VGLFILVQAGSDKGLGIITPFRDKIFNLFDGVFFKPDQCFFFGGSFCHDLLPE
jgi:hypothetical protein